MNKKNISLILLITCFLSLMAISVWGKKAELGVNVLATNLKIFTNENELVETIDDTDTEYNPYLIKLDKDDNKEVYEYYFYIKLEPDDTLKCDVDTSIKKGSKYVVVDELEYANWHRYSSISIEDLNETYHFYKLTFNRQDVLILEFAYNLEHTIIDKVNLKINWDGLNQGGTIDL